MITMRTVWWCLLLHVTSSTISDYPCSFRVSSVNHAFGPYGKYFNFDIYTIDAMLQRTNWSYQNFSLYNSRTNTISKCMIWRKANGGDDSGHGRKDDGTQSFGDFQIGDLMAFADMRYSVNCIMPSTSSISPTSTPPTSIPTSSISPTSTAPISIPPTSIPTSSISPTSWISSSTLYNEDISEYPCSFRVSSVNHAFGPYGKYLNFDIYAIDAMLQRSDWSAQHFNLYNSRTHTISKCILWRYANGGDDSGHGRKDDYTQSSGNFQIGDLMAFADITVNCIMPSPYIISSTTSISPTTSISSTTAIPPYPDDDHADDSGDNDNGNNIYIVWVILAVIIFIIVVFLVYRYMFIQKKVSEEIAAEAKLEKNELDGNTPKHEEKTHEYGTTNTSDDAPPPYDSTLNEQQEGYNDNTLQYVEIEGK